MPRPFMQDPTAALQQALYGGQQGPFVPTTPSPAMAPAGQAEPSLMDRPDIQQLMSVLYPQQPEPEQPGAGFRATLADALSAYAAGMGAGQRTDFLGQLKAKREQAKGLPKERARTELELKIREAEQGRQDKRKTQESELERAATIQEQRFRSSEAEKARGSREEIEQAKLEGREEVARLRSETDKMIADVRAGSRGSEDALRDRIRQLQEPDEVEKRTLGKEKREAATNIKSEISTFAIRLPEALQKFGNPDAVRDYIFDQMDVYDLSEADRKAVMDFYNKRLGTKLHPFSNAKLGGSSSADPKAGGGAGRAF